VESVVEMLEMKLNIILTCLLFQHAKVEKIQEVFPFTKFFENASQPIFKGRTFEEDFDLAEGCFRHIKKLFTQLEVTFFVLCALRFGCWCWCLIGRLVIMLRNSWQYRWLGGVVVRVSDLSSTGCEFDSRPCIAELVLGLVTICWQVNHRGL